MHKIPLPNTNHNFSEKIFFFPFSIIEFSNLDPFLRKSESSSVFKFSILRVLLGSYDHLRTLFIIVINLDKFVLLQDLDLASVI